jgi:hypothetical protein
MPVYSSLHGVELYIYVQFKLKLFQFGVFKLAAVEREEAFNSLERY